VGPRVGLDAVVKGLYKMDPGSIRDDVLTKSQRGFVSLLVFQFHFSDILN
jgi:hypothetical protein